MKITFKIFALAIMAGLTNQIPAQSSLFNLPTQYTILHNFAGAVDDGALPYCGLTFFNGELFGTTDQGAVGDSMDGTLFKIKLDGSAYAILHQFDRSDTDGCLPYASPIVLGGNIYGTTYLGPAYTVGTQDLTIGMIYACPLTNTSSIFVLKNFLASTVGYANDDGEFPMSQLVLVGNKLYGTTIQGGQSDYSLGTVFTVGKDGAGFAVLHSFISTNVNEGLFLQAGLAVGGSTGSNTVLYGVTVQGGATNAGTVFKINTDGSGYAILYNFGGGIDGGAPSASLTFADGELYGTTPLYPYEGTVFRMNADGSGYTLLHSLGGSDADCYSGPLAIAGDTLYGSVQGKLGYNNGFLFSIKTNGTDYTVLHEFTGYPDDGANPHCSLTIVTNRTKLSRPCCPPNPDNVGCNCILLINVTNTILYGTTMSGGSNEMGSIFALPLSNTHQTNEFDTLPMTITSPSIGSMIYSPDNVTVNVSGSGFTNMSFVEFYSNDILLGLTTNPPCSFTWTNAEFGTNTIFVVGYNSGGIPIGAAKVNFVYIPQSPTLGNDQVAADTYSFDISGDPGSVWQICRSTNLVDWTQVGSITLTNGAATFTDTSIDEIPGNGSIVAGYYKLKYGSVESAVVGFNKIVISADAPILWLTNLFYYPDSSINNVIPLSAFSGPDPSLMIYGGLFVDVVNPIIGGWNNWDISNLGDAWYFGEMDGTSWYYTSADAVTFTAGDGLQFYNSTGYDINFILHGIVY